MLNNRLKCAPFFWTIFLRATVGRHSCQVVFLQVLPLLLAQLEDSRHSDIIRHDGILTYINKNQKGSRNNLVIAFEGGQCLYFRN